jgi:hypothetical protein
MNRALILVGLLSSTVFVALAPCAVANTAWYVNGVHGSDGNNCKSPSTACKTIGHAISLASSGDSVLVAAATYRERLSIGISLTIDGSGASTTIINGNAAGTAVVISSAATVTLSGVTITNGFNPYVGGGISNSGTLQIVNSAVSGNRAGRSTCGQYCSAFGGGIYNTGGLTISQSTVSGNYADATCSKAPCGGAGEWRHSQRRHADNQQQYHQRESRGLFR